MGNPSFMVVYELLAVELSLSIARCFTDLGLLRQGIEPRSPILQCQRLTKKSHSGADICLLSI